MIRARSRWTRDNVAVVIGRTALGLGLALALALLTALAVDAAQPEAPYTCRLYYEAERNCGACRIMGISKPTLYSYLEEANG